MTINAHIYSQLTRFWIYNFGAMFGKANTVVSAKPNITLWKGSTLHSNEVNSINQTVVACTLHNADAIPYHRRTYQSGLLRSIHNESSSVARYVAPLLCHNISERTPRRLHSIMNKMQFFSLSHFYIQTFKRQRIIDIRQALTFTKMFYDCDCNQNISTVACCFSPMAEA